MRFSSHCANDVSTFIVSQCSLLPPDCIQNAIGRITVYRWFSNKFMDVFMNRTCTYGSSLHDHSISITWKFGTNNEKCFSICDSRFVWDEFDWVSIERLVIYAIRWWWLSDLAILSGHRAIMCSFYFSIRPRNQIKIQSMDSPSFLPIDYPIWKYFRCHT